MAIVVEMVSTVEKHNWRMIPKVFRDGKWGLNLEDGLGLFGGRRGDIMKQNLRCTGCRDLEIDLPILLPRRGWGWVFC
jgi:hypothetical protein